MNNTDKDMWVECYFHATVFEGENSRPTNTGCTLSFLHFLFQQKIGAFNAPRKDGPEKMFILLFF